MKSFESPIVFLDDRVYQSHPIDQILTKIIRPNSHSAPKAPNISQRYYEAILEQSKSVIITHQDRDGEHAFSKMKILHILSPT